MPNLAQAFAPGERAGYIGMSEIAAIMGIDKYRTPLDVYNEKKGLTEPFAGNNHTARGNRMEQVACEEYTILTGKKLQRRNEAFIHPVFPYIQGHIDRVVVGHRRIAEVKCPSVAAFRMIQRNGVPQNWILQVNGYMGLAGYAEAELIVFCADQFEISHHLIDFDTALYQQSIDACVAFWSDHILTDTPPALAFGGTSEVEITKVGGDVIRLESEAFDNALRLYAEGKRVEKEAKDLIETAKESLTGAVEAEYGVYESSLGSFSFKQQAGRKTFDQKALAATFPQIDLKPFTKQGDPFDAVRVTVFEGLDS